MTQTEKYFIDQRRHARTIAFYALTFAAFAFIVLAAWLNVILSPIGKL